MRGRAKRCPPPSKIVHHIASMRQMKSITVWTGQADPCRVSIRRSKGPRFDPGVAVSPRPGAEVVWVRRRAKLGAPGSALPPVPSRERRFACHTVIGDTTGQSDTPRTRGRARRCRGHGAASTDATPAVQPHPSFARRSDVKVERVTIGAGDGVHLSVEDPRKHQGAPRQRKRGDH